MSRYIITIDPADFNRRCTVYVWDTRLESYIVPGESRWSLSIQRLPFMEGSVTLGEIEDFVEAFNDALDAYKMEKDSHVLKDKHRLTLEFGTAFREARGDEEGKASATRPPDEGHKRELGNH